VMRVGCVLSVPRPQDDSARRCHNADGTWWRTLWNFGSGDNATFGVFSRFWGAISAPSSGGQRSEHSKAPRQLVRCRAARRPMHELTWLRRSRPTKRPINQYPLSASPLNDANLMAGLHAGDRVDTKPTEQGGGIESL
jgi:hypothetical protein